MRNSSSPPFFLIFFTTALFDFSLSRLSFEDTEGLVFLLAFGTIEACLMRSTSLSSASCLFCSWLREARAMITISPSAGILCPARALSRVFTYDGRPDEAASNLSWTAVAALFTCWPPGPPARMKSHLSSDSSSHIVSVTFIMDWSLHQPVRIAQVEIQEGRRHNLRPGTVHFLLAYIPVVHTRP